jgi:DMSO/TMAO reductase YedYZ molybdopterin-dependent catalytic subunit
MKNTKKIFHTFLLILSIFLIFSISGCLQQTIHLKGVELREYQGQKLSSINDFHENSIKGPHYINNTTYRLHITGLVDNPKNFTIDEIINNLHHIKKIATLNCVEGWSVTILWEGVLVKDLLNETKLNSSGKIILFKAYDGYTTSFPISYIMNNSIILAYKMNNITIPPERGYPFQLVAEGKWGYKWIKWVTEIEVTNSTQLSGYRENRGYSDSGDLNASYIG